MTKIITNINSLAHSSSHSPTQTKEHRTKMALVAQRFRVAVPKFALDAPAEVKRQYLPDISELQTSPTELPDPIGDEPHQKTAGLIHRYRNRVLLMPTYHCGVYCRFCFRRTKVGRTKNLSLPELQKAFDYIKANRSISEVILSGGDPMLLSAKRLGFIFEKLKSISHIQKIRIHTRMPVALPDALSEAKMAVLAGGAPNLVIHCNSALELSPKVCEVLQRLKKVVKSLRCQSVLLKGINDSPHQLALLFRALVANGVRPYYLHHPDKAQGTGHFRVSLKRGRMLVRQTTKLMARETPKVVMPKYVVDLPNGHGKVCALAAKPTQKGWLFRDRKGMTHFYRDAP